MPVDAAQAIKQAVRATITDMFVRAAADKLDMVVLAGDLFEHEGTDPAAQLRFIYEQAASIAPVPVVITPGNHDPICAESPYATIAWPENVILFTGGEFTQRDTPAGPVVGRAVQAGEGTGAVDWSRLPIPVGETPLLVIHASMLRASDGRRGRNTVAPVTLDKLQHCGYSYVAMGHYHRFQQWPHLENGLVCTAYPGCPQGQGWDEPGEKGYLLVQLEPEGATVEFAAASRHIWHRAALQLPPEHVPDADIQLLASRQAIYDELADGSLLKLVVTGRWPADKRVELEEQIGAVGGHAWHTEAPDLSAVDFHPPLIGYGDSAVADAFLDRCDAAMQTAGSDDEDREVWLLTRYLGRRLLSGQGLPEEVV